MPTGNHKITYLDLFAGAGGLSEGFATAGYQPIAHVEMDADACNTLKTRESFYYLNTIGVKCKYAKGAAMADEDVETTHYWLYSPGEGASIWDECYAKGIMAIGWDEIGDLSQYASKTEMKQAMKRNIDPDLRKLLVFFDEVEAVNLYSINWNMQYNRNNQTYRMLITVCYLVVKGLSDRPHEVSGMLLYARTDEDIFPENEYRMSGNRIEVRTLNLDGDFAVIKAQLDGIARKYLGVNAA